MAGKIAVLEQVSVQGRAGVIYGLPVTVHVLGTQAGTHTPPPEAFYSKDKI